MNTIWREDNVIKLRYFHTSRKIVKLLYGEIDRISRMFAKQGGIESGHFISMLIHNPSKPSSIIVTPFIRKPS